jgi:putative ABC transport system permease protein
MSPSVLTRWLDVIPLRFRSVFRRTRVDAELDREMRAHLEHQIDENIALGMSPDNARFAALRAFGGMEQMKEQARDARGTAVIDNLARDLRYTLRGLLREPMLVLAATASIALGVGGNLAVFSLAKDLLFAPPDVRRPKELVTIRVSHGSHVGYQKWLDIKASDVLEDVAGYSIEKQLNWLNGDAAVSITPMFVTANFFDVTGIPFARGRGFSAAEARAETDPHLVVVSHSFWQRELAGDSAVIGRGLVLNGESYTVLGVLAPRLRSVAGFGISPSVYVPVASKLVPEMLIPGRGVVQLLGRLKPEQSVAQGRAAMDALDRRLGRLQGDTVWAGVQEFAPTGGPARAMTLKPIIGAFFVLLALVSLFVLLIACANVAGLLIARGTARRQEIAVRLALGGTRGRLLQQFLVEGFWLALLGSAFGLGLSAAFMRLVNGYSFPVPLPLELHLAPDVPVVVCALGLVVLSMLLCALLPALHATRLSLTPALKREEPHYAHRRFTTRAVLLAGQVTVSTVLLVTAFLFVRNLSRTQVTNPGFEVEHALVAEVGFVQGRPGMDHVTLLQAAVERVRALPGVESAAYADAVPLTIHNGSFNGRDARINASAQSEHVEFAQSAVGPGYFSTLGIRLLQGREFLSSDAVGAPPVVIVNEEFTRRYFAGRSPVGSTIEFPADKAPTAFQIVGVVANSKHRTIGEDQRPAFYVPLLQRPGDVDLAYVLMRTRSDPASLVTLARQAIGELDRSMAVDVEPMRASLAISILPSQIGAAVLGTLGTLGLVLAMFGLYAIVSYSVSRRIGEIAIRVALGATRSGIVRLVVRDASVLVGMGLLLGLGISALVTRPLAAFLVAGLSPSDPLSFGATALAFVVVALLASWLPARHATQVSPVIAMRLE